MTDIYIYGTINNFALSELAGVEEDVTVHLNSYGGRDMRVSGDAGGLWRQSYRRQEQLIYVAFAFAVFV